MRLEVRRSILIYFAYSVGFFLLSWKAFYSIATRGVIEVLILKWVFWPIYFSVFLRLIFNMNYIVVEGTKLTIYRDLFMKESFQTDRLAKIEIATSPFEKSFFVLDNHSRFDFNAFYVSSRSLLKLAKYLGKELN